MNILDYIDWRGDIEIEYDGFNEVDNLIFSRLSYLPFEKLNYFNKLTIKELYYKILDSNLSTNSFLHSQDINLLRAMALSKRYKNIIITNFNFIREKKEELQFCALTFILPNNYIYIAYRGTDNTLVGWKEDFDMTYKDFIPSQQLALTYLNNTSTFFKKIYIGGHSKGGNLAMYASIYTKESVKNKIIKIFNNDGPGFLENIVNSIEYKSIKSKICTFIPQTSIVGKLLNNTSNYTVIKSDESFVYQHDPYSWIIKKDSFIYLSDTDKGSKIINKVTSKWIATASLEEREKVINLCYNILTKNNFNTLDDIKNNKFDSIKKIYNEYKNMTKEDKELLEKVLSYLVKAIKESVFDKNEK